MKKIFLLCLGLSFAFAMFSQCENGRYLNQLFPTVSVESDILYGSNFNWDGSEESLFLDVYQPEGDTEVNRPLIIFAHGGSFIAGSKEGPDVVPLCEDFAKMGYVTASIQYRLGTPFTTQLEIPMKQAVVRGYHDMKAAIRWFRKNVAEDGNTYNIDGDKIIIAGVSAGGFITTHVAYLDEEGEMLPEIDQTLQGLTGGLDGDSGNPGFSSEVLGVVNIAGALGSTDWMQAGDEPILSFHGTSDATVPYDESMLQVGGVLDIDTVAGSSAIHARADEIGLVNCFESHFLEGHLPHVSNPAYYDTTRSIMSNFSAHLVCPTVELDCEYREIILDIAEAEKEDALLIYPNPASEEIQLINPFSGNTQIEIVNIQGQTVLSFDLSDEQKLVEISDFARGNYVIRFKQGEMIRNEQLIIE